MNGQNSHKKNYESVQQQAESVLQNYIRNYKKMNIKDNKLK